jgi:hypothetical protein
LNVGLSKLPPKNVGLRFDKQMTIYHGLKLELSKTMIPKGLVVSEIVEIEIPHSL